MDVILAEFSGGFREQTDRCRRSSGRRRLLRDLVRPLQDDQPQSRGTGEGARQRAVPQGKVPHGNSAASPSLAIVFFPN